MPPAGSSARAARAAGKTDVAKTYYKTLIDVMDPLSARPELKEAKQIVLEE